MKREVVSVKCAGHTQANAAFYIAWRAGSIANIMARVRLELRVCHAYVHQALQGLDDKAAL